MYSKIKSHHKKQSSSPRVVAIVIAGAVVLGVAGYALLNNPQNSPKTSTSNSNADTNSLLSSEKKKSSTEQSNENKANQQNVDGTTAEKLAVEPVISFTGIRNGNAEVRSYVGEVYESSGNCTATFTKSGQTLTKTVDGLKDATYTRCDRVVVPLGDFKSSGNWTVKIEYNSPTANGVSPERVINIP